MKKRKKYKPLSTKVQRKGRVIKVTKIVEKVKKKKSKPKGLLDKIIG